MPNVRSWRAAIGCIAGCCLAASVFGAAAQDRSLTDAPGPIDVVTRPAPLERMIKRFYRDSPDCVSAKLDIWFAGGRYAHQLFTSRGLDDRAGGTAVGVPRTQETWEGDSKNPATRQILDADSTTIIVGRAGCRYRVRIERGE